MHTIHVNLLKSGILLWIPVLMLTACTNKSDIMLELETQEAVSEETASIAEDEPERVMPSETAGKEIKEQENTPSEALSSEIYVHICGAVLHPGVYALAADSRVFEAIAAAGGFRQDACEDFINQAMPLQDGQKLTVPTVKEAQLAKEEGAYSDVWISGASVADASGTVGKSGGASRKEAGAVNINTATEEELGEIPGIGAGKAAAIVKYRQENGAFTVKEDIMKVSGIKEGTYEKIKDKITVN